jgi:hypothetical protein
VIDLRYVNEFLVKPTFKYEDLRALSQVVDEGHWFFTWDLKGGYHHVDINCTRAPAVFRFFLGF